MAILATGGAGYIGSHTALELLDVGEQVVVLDDLSTGFRGAVPDDATFIQGDISDQPLVADLVDKHAIDTIIHFAARTVVPDSVADPLAYYEANTAKSRALFRAAISAGVRRFVFSSTAAVYGNPSTNPVAETASLQPISPYGRSKLMTEWMLQDAAAAHNLDFVVLRYFNVAGADPRRRAGQSTARATHLIKVACEVATGQRPYLEVFGADFPTRDGTCERDFIHVTDLARAHLAAVHRLRSAPARLTLNCGYGRGYSVWEVVGAVGRATGTPIPTRVVERRAGDAACVIAEASSIRTELGWQPRFDSLDTIVSDALSWERHRLAREREHRGGLALTGAEPPSRA